MAVPGGPTPAPHPPGTGWAPGRSSRCGRTGRAARWWRCSVGFPPRPRPSLLAAPSARPRVSGRCGSGTGGCRQVWRGERGGSCPHHLRPCRLVSVSHSPRLAQTPQPHAGASLGPWLGVSVTPAGPPHPSHATLPLTGPRRRRLRAALPAGLYHLDEEVADLAQDDDEAGGRAVVLAVDADQAEGAHHPVQVGLQLREHRPSRRGRGCANEGQAEPGRI